MCYSEKYGWAPFVYFLNGKDFYSRRKIWLQEHQITSQIFPFNCMDHGPKEYERNSASDE